MKSQSVLCNYCTVTIAKTTGRKNLGQKSEFLRCMESGSPKLYTEVFDKLCIVLQVCFSQVNSCEMNFVYPNGDKQIFGNMSSK